MVEDFETGKQVYMTARECTRQCNEVKCGCEFGDCFGAFFEEMYGSAPAPAPAPGPAPAPAPSSMFFYAE